MIQDLPQELDNQYKPKQPSEKSVVLAFKEKSVYVIINDSEHRAAAQDAEGMDFATDSNKESFRFPFYSELMSICASPQVTYLFTIGEEDFFLTELSLEAQESLGGEFVQMFSVRAMSPKAYVMAAATGYHLFVWYRDNAFCGRCGEKTVHSDTLRMKKCPKCGNMIFPKLCPAVIVGVIHGDYILMTKYADRAYKRYALIAGFVEIGETGEECVAREVFEEVGLKVKNITYYKSQPWGFDSDLLLGYYCELDDSEEQNITLDSEELSTAEWVHYKDVPDDAEGLSLTAEMMTHFRDMKKLEK